MQQSSRLNWTDLQRDIKQTDRQTDGYPVAELTAVLKTIKGTCPNYPYRTQSNNYTAL